ncbi:MAG TPA: DUF6596 domain-containing protein, partial [Verrucomicrobiae bacterium]|nr:DUF6596 domain-containing protein [Verrucomicrobiae bacterium]
HAVGNQPQVHALLALMLLNAARLNARVDANGNLLRLREQDRSSWNHAMIARGMFHLTQSAKGNDLTAYHLQAAIAACHCSAPDWQSTDWPRILSLYDQLVKLDDSPVVALNRAVAVAEVRGPAEGIKSVAAIPDQKSLGAYYLFYAVLAEFEIQLKDFPAAAEHLRRALQLTEIKSERALLEARLRDCGK